GGSGDAAEEAEEGRERAAGARRAAAPDPGAGGADQEEREERERHRPGFAPTDDERRQDVEEDLAAAPGRGQLAIGQGAREGERALAHVLQGGRRGVRQVVERRVVA